MVRYLLLEAAAALVPRLPTRSAYFGAAMVADAAYATAGRARRQVSRNLAVVAGDGIGRDKLRLLTRLAFRNLVWNYLELFRLAGRGLEELRTQITADGLDHLTGATARSRTGAVIIFCHVGTLEAFSQLTNLLPGHRFLVVVENMADRRMLGLFERLRARQGLKLVRTDEPARLLRLLRAGWHVIISGDLDTTGTGTTVQFFGRPMRAPVGACRLAMSTGAPVLIAAGWREDMSRPHRIRARLSPPLALRGSARAPADVHAAVQHVVSVLAEQVAAHPEQWLAFREVWNA